MRFSPLLSRGAVIVSEHCQPEGERELEGLVKFGTVEELPGLLEAELARGFRTRMPEVARAFASRWQPEQVFERANVYAAMGWEKRNHAHHGKSAGAGRGAL